MIKKYSFSYNMHDAEVDFIIDTDVFTPEIAMTTLEFFTWEYDKEADPVDEVMKKYALEAIRIATFNNYNKFGVIREFMNNEGYCKVDGSRGIILTGISEYQFDESALGFEITELNKTHYLNLD